MNIAFFTIQTVNPFIGGFERVTHNLTQYFESPNIKVYYFIYKVKKITNILFYLKILIIKQRVLT